MELNKSLVADGCSCVVVNGDMIAQGSQFSLKDVEVVVAQVDLDAVCYDLLLLQCLFVYVMHLVPHKFFTVSPLIS